MKATTDEVLRAMSVIVVEAGTLVYQIEQDRSIGEHDRHALLVAASHIVADAEGVITWLLDAPLEVARQ